MPKKSSPLYEAETKRRVEAFRLSLLDESDRRLILVGGAFLEEELKALLHVYFASERSLRIPALTKIEKFEKISKELFSIYGGSLGTFGAKLNLAYAVGLLEYYEFRSIKGFSKVRNKFAHKIETNSLKSVSVADLVKNFLGTNDISRDLVAEKVIQLGALIITRVLILENAALDIETKRVLLGFAAKDPYNLRRVT